MVHRKAIVLSSVVLLLFVLATTYAADTAEEEQSTSEYSEHHTSTPSETTRRRRTRTVATSTAQTTTDEHTASTHKTATHEHTASTHKTATHEHTGSTHETTTHEHTASTHEHIASTPKRTTKRTTMYRHPYNPYKPSDDGKRRKQYGREREDGYDRQGGYNDNDYEITGYDGVDPREDGQDIGDFGPVYDKQESMYASMDIWISAADDWEGDQKSKYRNNKYSKSRDYKEKNNKDKDKEYKGRDDKDKDYKDNDDNKKDYNDNDYKKNDRKKRSYSRVRFPVRQYKDIRRFPSRRFPPLVSIFPWLPIFYDKFTYQTLIFSPTGGIYILPPLINFYGQRFAVAQLIKWGYASLVSSGAPPPPNVNVAPLVQPVPAGGPVAAGVVGSPAAAPPPRYDSKKYRFNDGVKTDFPSFKPRYGDTMEERGSGYRNNGGMNRDNYQSDSNYGGTGRQEVYAQGGPRNGGGGGSRGGYN